MVVRSQVGDYWNSFLYSPALSESVEIPLISLGRMAAEVAFRLAERRLGKKSKKDKGITQRAERFAMEVDARVTKVGEEPFFK